MSKKIIFTTILSIFICTSIFAQTEQNNIQEETSNSTETTTSDSYDDYEETKTTIEIPSSQKKKNPFLDMFKFGNIEKYVELDTTSCFSKNAVGSLKQYAATVTLDPELLEAGFGTRYLAGYYYIFIDAENRALLKKAMEKYFSDFENKNLERKNKKTEKTYGKMKLRLRWGTTKTSTPNNGEGKVNLGYEFVNNSPYFKISIPEIENKYYEVTNAVSRGSSRIYLYFTKSQLASLVEMISDKNLADAMIKYNEEISGTHVETEKY